MSSGGYSSLHSISDTPNSLAFSNIQNKYSAVQYRSWGSSPPRCRPPAAPGCRSAPPPARRTWTHVSRVSYLLSRVIAIVTCNTCYMSFSPAREHRPAPGSVVHVVLHHVVGGHHTKGHMLYRRDCRRKNFLTVLTVSNLYKLFIKV